jgi:hypothetical protein
MIARTFDAVLGRGLVDTVTLIVLLILPLTSSAGR